MAISVFGCEHLKTLGTAFSLPVLPGVCSSGLFSIQMDKAHRLLLGPSWCWWEVEMDPYYRKLEQEWRIRR